MKKNLLGVFAVVLAIAASSFTAKSVTQYFVYKGSSFTQNLVTSYTRQSTQPVQVSSTGILNWIQVTDDNGSVTQAEFSPIFSSYDTNLNGTLNDEAVITGSLDRKLP